MDAQRTTRRTVHKHTQVIPWLLRVDRKYKIDHARDAAMEIASYPLWLRLNTDVEVPQRTLKGFDLDSGVSAILADALTDALDARVPEHPTNFATLFLVTEFTINPQWWLENGIDWSVDPSETTSRRGDVAELYDTILYGAQEWAEKKFGATKVMALALCAEPFCVPVVRVLVTLVTDSGEVGHAHFLGTATEEHNSTRELAQWWEKRSIGPVNLDESTDKETSS